MRVAIVHDWLTGMRGGERVLEALLEMYPEAEIFTLLHEPGSVSGAIESRPIHTSAIDRVPGRARLYRYLLPLFPWAVERFDLAGFDLVISSSHCVAKGARVPAHVPHICYCHTPMRYIWDQYDAYFAKGRASLPVRLAMGAIVERLRSWDASAAHRVDHFVANSTHIAGRIRRHYGRDASVVHPPVDLTRFEPGVEPRVGAYLYLGALVPYKRVDLAVRAFNRMRKPLVVAGGGVEYDRLSRLAGPTVEVRGPVDDATVCELLASSRALVMPGVEDFGIVVVEALASGTPVIALGEGGVRDTVRVSDDGHGVATGVFFTQPSIEGLVEAVERFERQSFDPEEVAASAEGFGKERFQRELAEVIDGVLRAWPAPTVGGGV